MFKGNWVPYPDGPYYADEMKCVIDKRQNFLKFGRPDTGFISGVGNPTSASFGRLLDESPRHLWGTVARYQMQSLICLLTNVSAEIIVKKY